MLSNTLCDFGAEWVWIKYVRIANMWRPQIRIYTIHSMYCIVLNYTSIWFFFYLLLLTFEFVVVGKCRCKKCVTHCHHIQYEKQTNEQNAFQQQIAIFSFGNVMLWG